MKLLAFRSSIRVLVLFVVYLMFLQGVASADDRKFRLGDQRLFMSIEQRQEIDQPPALITEVAPEIGLPVVQVIEKKAKRPNSKVSLHGAVLRPDGSATLFMNSGTRNIASRKKFQTDRFSFSIKVNNRLVVLKPGQTAWVSNSND